MIVAIALGAKRGNTVKRALLVDRVTVVEAVVTADTLESVRLLGGAELARLVTLVVTVAVAARRGDTVLGALVVDGHFVARTVLAWNAGSAVHVVEIVVLQLDCIAEGVLVCAELGHGVALGVRALHVEPVVGTQCLGHLWSTESLPRWQNWQEMHLCLWPLMLEPGRSGGGGRT